MVYVRLAQGWTDSTGVEHPAGAMIDVDAATLAGLESRGVVAEAGSSPQPADGDESGGNNPAPNGGIPSPGSPGDPGTDGGIPPPG